MKIEDIKGLLWDKDNKRGYNNDVFVLDYAALYPTQMRDFSINPRRTLKIKKVLEKINGN